MNTNAFILMSSTLIGITAITVFFFMKVLFAKPEDKDQDEIETND